MPIMEEIKVNSIVKVHNLEKSYHTKKAVNGINFVVNEGEILGFLGPNGAGKSTTINILSTILSMDQGEVTIFDRDLKKNVKEIKRLLGVVPQELAIYEEITAIQNVRFFGSLYGINGKQLELRAKEALELVGLYDKKDDKPKTFSGGMKRRLNIACAIVHQPELIIMDEPTVGIDPQSRNHILESIRTLRQRGATVIYSTHYMEEVEAICDRIIIMNEGTIIAEGTKEELNQKVNNDVTYYFEVEEKEKCNEQDFLDLKGVREVVFSESNIAVTSDQSEENLNDIISVIIANGCKIESMRSEEASLETVFLELTGRKLRDEYYQKSNAAHSQYHISVYLNWGNGTCNIRQFWSRQCEFFRLQWDHNDDFCGIPDSNDSIKYIYGRKSKERKYPDYLCTGFQSENISVKNDFYLYSGQYFIQFHLFSRTVYLPYKFWRKKPGLYYAAD